MPSVIDKKGTILAAPDTSEHRAAMKAARGKDKLTATEKTDAKDLLRRGFAPLTDAEELKLSDLLRPLRTAFWSQRTNQVRRGLK